ncbi:class I SAM-dependent methyltransferase [Pseudogemmobacter bohemicus]|uniref:class I SAM-dependent methyltransferase n=1 Tax=Pseudogemmobacter bohemicus TaxID=2250708 RepID=UPI000DD484D3|nr:class I SAM-dependent methyltransferase [Pseudogemmobacter bohemicus]
MKAAAVTASYKRWAPVYDSVFGKVFHEGRKRATSHATARGGDVLEVGVGTGLALPLYGPGVTITGIDFSTEMLARAETRVREHRLTNVSLRQMDAQVLDFPDASFDTVSAMHVLSVVPDPEKALSEIARVCRPGAHVLITNHFAAQKKGPLKFAERLIQPFQHQLGWQADFPIARVLGDARLRLVERRPLPPLGAMTWLVLERV